MNFKAFLPLACSALLLSACGESEVTLNYKVATPVEIELYAESYFATIDMNGEEQMGTITAAYADLNYSSVGDTLVVKREYKIDKSRGYLKNYMPSELAWRVKNVDVKAVDRKVISVEGLEDGYDSLLQRIPMPERWRKQLLNPSYKPHLKRLEKHRWEMDHLLTGTVPVKANITKMLDYVVYLHETESFPYYIWEQHVNSNIIPDKYKAYTDGHKAEYDTQFEVMIDPETGVPCQEREVKVGTHTMVHPVTKDTVKFTSHVTNERLYNLKVKYEEPTE